MRKKWMQSLGMLGLLVLLGCRTPQPNLKPPTSAEVLATPPADRRYNASVYPKEAFYNRDPLKKLHSDQEVIPARAPALGPGYGTPGANPAGGMIR